MIVPAIAGRAAAARIAINRVAFNRFFMFPPICVGRHALFGKSESKGQAVRCIAAQFLAGATMEGAGVKFFKNRPKAKFGKYGMRSFAHASSLIVAIVLRRRPSLAIRCA